MVKIGVHLQKLSQN